MDIDTRSEHSGVKTCFINVDFGIIQESIGLKLANLSGSRDIGIGLGNMIV